MSEEMSSKNSNNSDIEVIGPEDLEDSPPPQDTTEADTKPEDAQVEIEVKEASPEVSGSGDQETEAIGEVKEAAPAPTPAADKDDDDPPIEVLAPAAPDQDDPPVELLAPAPDPAPAPEPAVRPVVTATRPAATLEEVEDDGEEDDDDIDETLAERLLGLTEMFPDFVTNGTVSIVKVITTQEVHTWNIFPPLCLGVFSRKESSIFILSVLENTPRRAGISCVCNTKTPNYNR